MRIDSGAANIRIIFSKTVLAMDLAVMFCNGVLTTSFLNQSACMRLYLYPPPFVLVTGHWPKMSAAILLKRILTLIICNEALLLFPALDRD